MLSEICPSLDWSKILSSGNGLNHCGKRGRCWYLAISAFHTIFSALWDFKLPSYTIDLIIKVFNM